MLNITKDRLISTLFGVIIGLVIGAMVTVVGGVFAYKVYKHLRQETRYEPEVRADKKPAKMARQAGGGFYLSFENDADTGVLAPSGTVTCKRVRENTTQGNYSLMVNIEPQAEYPGIGWEVYGRDVQNWSGAKDFHFDVFNNTENTVGLNVKFKSGNNYPKKSYSYPASLEPLKMNHVSIPLENIAQECDLTQMSYVKLFVSSPGEGIVLYFDNMGTRESGAKDKAGPINDTAAVTQKDEKRPSHLKEGFKVFVASSLDKVFRDGKTLTKPCFADEAKISLARNEYESFQVVVANGSKPLAGVRAELADLVNNETGTRIGRANISWRVVGYVPTQKPYYPVKYVGLWPDPLMPGEKVDIKAGETQPLWITVYTPKDTPAGKYTGVVKINLQEFPPVTIPVEVTVYNFTLPAAGTLKTAFDFYPHITSSRYPRKEYESDAQYKYRIGELNDRYMVDMLKYRIDPILNMDPASDTDLNMVERYKKYGLNNFAIGKRGGTFNNNWPKSDEGIEALLPLYRTYGEVLKLNKMIDSQYIYTWDESDIGNPRIAKICSMIHRAYPALKNMVCYHGFWDPEKDSEWGKDIDIWCFGIGDYNMTKIEKLRKLGMEMWVYVSGPGGSGNPNLAIDFDAIDCRIIPWLCWKYDIKGFLYWCVNWWPFADPFKSAANTKWNQNGNGLLYYPGENGPIASLRLEIFRDGMEDYEYIAMLNDKLKILKQDNTNAQYTDAYKKALELLMVAGPLASSMSSFTKDGSVLLSRREKIAQAIEELSGSSKNTASASDSPGRERQGREVTEDFSQPIVAQDGKTFGEYGQFTFELFRNGTFVIDGKSGAAWQRSNRYSDVAIIRSTKPLPKTYKISAVVGEIDYDLSKVKFVENDPQYKEGPLNENGCYLLAITDEEPSGHYTNDWWHKHRKVCIDVDNNIWGHGMPHPVFMVYFDGQNNLIAFDGGQDIWQKEWRKAVTYEPAGWYRVEIEKTRNEFILRIYDKEEKLLKEGSVDLAKIWHEDGEHQDYLVIGDPHENYYQGSMKIKSISMPAETDGK
ncbi:MAG: glycoside hydrolase domain-containing protein [Candidatus Omnitrophota bacterium]